MLMGILELTIPADMSLSTLSPNALPSRKSSATKLHGLYQLWNARMIMKRSAKSFLRMCLMLLRNKRATMKKRRFVSLRSASNLNRLKSMSTRRCARRCLANSAPVLTLNNWFPRVPQQPLRTAVMSQRRSAKMSPRTSATRCPRRSRSSVATMNMKLNMGRASQPTQLDLVTQLKLNHIIAIQLNLSTQLDLVTQLKLNHTIAIQLNLSTQQCQHTNSLSRQLCLTSDPRYS